MKKMLHDMFYQNDGTLDLSRVLMTVLVLAYIGQSAYALIRGQAFDWQSFGVGGGALLGGSGAGVWLHGRAP
ncbi:MAG: amino acid ABC transporter substrate-binding protein [Gammaproteobacteria bacterium]